MGNNWIMNIHALATLLWTTAIGMEILGFVAIRFGRNVSLPVFINLGRRLCYLAPLVLIVGLIGIAMARLN